jgi:hypothetical protein
MPEIGTFGLMSGDGKRSVGNLPQATAPILDSTYKHGPPASGSAYRGEPDASATVSARQHLTPEPTPQRSGDGATSSSAGFRCRSRPAGRGQIRTLRPTSRPDIGVLRRIRFGERAQRNPFEVERAQRRIGRPVALLDDRAKRILVHDCRRRLALNLGDEHGVIDRAAAVDDRRAGIRSRIGGWLLLHIRRGRLGGFEPAPGSTDLSAIIPSMNSSGVMSVLPTPLAATASMAAAMIAVVLFGGTGWATTPWPRSTFSWYRGSHGRFDTHVVAVARTVGGLEELDDAIGAVGSWATLVPLDLKDTRGSCSPSPV